MKTADVIAPKRDNVVEMVSGRTQQIKFVRTLIVSPRRGCYANLFFLGTVFAPSIRLPVRGLLFLLDPVRPSTTTTAAIAHMALFNMTVFTGSAR